MRTPKLVPPPSPQSTIPALATLLLPYQRRWLADNHGICVCEKSRRVGITWTEAARAVLTAADPDGADVFYLSYNYDVARGFIDHDVQDWTKRFNIVARAAGQTLWERDDETHESIYAYHVEFASGHKIYGLTSKPRSLRSRGRPGELAIIDEAAMHDDLDEVIKAALAFTMLGGRVHIISTHNGANSAFNELVLNIRAGRMPQSCSLHRITIDDALASGYYRQVAAPLRGEDPTAENEAAWREERFAEYGINADEELLVIPSESGGVFMSTALIESVMDPEIPVVRWHCRADALERGAAALVRDADDWIRAELEPRLRRLDSHLMSCFGEDFGRSGDLTVIWPLQITNDVRRRTPFIIELRNVPFEQQRQILFALCDRLPRLIGGAMDARGNGQYLAEVAALRYGARIDGVTWSGIEQVMLSVDWYRDNMPRYKAAFEDGKINLPRDAGVLSDHRMLRMEKGVARVPETRTREAGGGQRHGDSAIAGALALYASYSGHTEYKYETPNKPHAQDRDLEEDLHSGWDMLGGSRAGFRRKGAW